MSIASTTNKSRPHIRLVRESRLDLVHSEICGSIPHQSRLAIVENQTDRKLKCLRSDNGGQYKSNKFFQFCQEHGIRREHTAPYSPEQNGVAERRNWTIQERIVSMLHHSGLTDGFWAEALLTAVHIINMSPSRPLGSKIPQELWR
jgi:transposase InsO family protein